MSLKLNYYYTNGGNREGTVKEVYWAEYNESYCQLLIIANTTIVNPLFKIINDEQRKYLKPILDTLCQLLNNKIKSEDESTLHIHWLTEWFEAYLNKDKLMGVEAAGLILDGFIVGINIEDNEKESK